MSTKPDEIWLLGRGGDGASRVLEDPPLMLNTSWNDEPRFIACEALMVEFGSLLVGEDSTVRVPADCEGFLAFEKKGASVLVGKKPF